MSLTVQALRARAGRHDRDEPLVDYEGTRPVRAIVTVRRGNERATGIAWEADLTSPVARRHAHACLVIAAESRALRSLLDEVP